MGSQKKVLQITALLIAAVFLTACGANKPVQTSTTVAGSSYRNFANGTGTSTNTTCVFPCVALIADTESFYEQAIYGLLDAAPMGAIGQVSLQAGTQIGMKLDFEQAINPNYNNTSAVVPENTGMQMIIHFTSSSNNSGPVEIQFDGNDPSVSIQGGVAGNMVTVNFADQYGEITIVGTIQGANFVGSVAYDNCTPNMSSCSSNSSLPEGVLKFSIPTCQALNCSN